MALRNIVSIVLQGVDKFSPETKKAKKELTGLEKSTSFLRDKLIGPGGLAAAAGIAAVGLGALVTQTATEADQIGKFAERIGVSTEFLSEMGVVADRSGVPVSQLQTGLQRLSRRAAEFATTGGGEAADTFRRLGVEVRNADGTIRSVESLLPELADKFANLSDSQEATALAFKLFDTEGVSFLQFLRQGAPAIAAMRAEAASLGVTIDQDMATSAAKFNDALGRLTDSFKGLRNAIAGELLDDLVTFIDLMTKAVQLQNELRTGVSTEELQDEETRLKRIAELQQRIAAQQRFGLTIQVGAEDPRAFAARIQLFARMRKELDELVKVQQKLIDQQTGFVGPRPEQAFEFQGPQALSPEAALQQQFGGITGALGTRPTDVTGGLGLTEPSGGLPELDQLTDAEKRFQSIVEFNRELPGLIDQRLAAEERYAVQIAVTDGAINAISGSLTALTDTILEGGNVFKIQFGDVFQNVGKQALATINQLIARMIVLRSLSALGAPVGFLGSFLGIGGGDQSRVADARRVANNGLLRELERARFRGGV